MHHVLSIQSHVASGHVGNAAAVFPLQRLGIEVSAIHTVQFSNHTGYGSWTGQVFTAEHIADVLEGMAARGALDRLDGVLSGYMGDATLGGLIVETAERARKNRPGCLYCCDPVIGDVGRGVFVRPGIPEFMRERAVPAADIVTPNQFELEYLTGRTVGSLDDAMGAAEALRALGPTTVLVTSLSHADTPEGTIGMMVDTADGTWLVATPRLPIDPAPNGAGDCVSALFLARMLETGAPAAALEHTAAAIFAIFEVTHRAGTRELQLIAAQDAIVAPPRRFPVERVR